MKTVWVLLITFNQRVISPHKGFKCAHASVHGGNSCSEAIKIIIQEEGLIIGYPKIRTRFDDCKLAYYKFSKPRERTFQTYNSR